MTLEEAISTALEYEAKVHDVYNEAAEKATDEMGKKIFLALANEEQGHLDYLNAKLKQWRDTGKLTQDTLETVVPPADKIAAGVAKLKEKTGGKEYKIEVELLQRALEVENETSTFYKKMVAELDADGKAMFERFVEIEEGHYAIVQAEIDAVNGMGFWFDFQEFSLEGG